MSSASLALLSLAACGCSGKSADPPRLVILYVPCSLQARSLAPYDPKIPFTPNLAEFARGSVVFQRHTTEAEQSGTGFASIFTGTQAPKHGIYNHPTPLGDDRHLVAESFAENGYETWFWSGHPMAGASLNYGQGVAPERTVVATKRDNPQQWLPGDPQTLTANDPKFDALLDSLVADPAKRAFVQVNFTLTHDPYYQFCTKTRVTQFCRDFPERSGGLTLEEIERYQGLYSKHFGQFQWNYPQTVEALHLSAEDEAKLSRTMQIFYETAVRELDRLFGSFVEKIRQRDLSNESLIVFTVDHGEILDRENALFRWGHGLQLAPEALDVPLIIHAPGRLRPGAYAGVTRSIDVFPTLAGLCGIPVSSSYGIEGVDLSAAVEGDETPPVLRAFSHSTVFGPMQFESLIQYANVARYFTRRDPEGLWVRVRSRDIVCKLRNLGEERFGFELFDLSQDPFETHNLFDPANAEHAALARSLESYKAELAQGYAKVDASRRLPPEEELERLKRLGYVK